MSNTIDEIINEAKLFYCVECGKCVGACPMREVYEEFSYELSPRCINKKALLGFDILDIVKGKEIWFCLGCTVCTEICPAGVRYAEFV
jgi:heterodisulfide reductase subunit C